MMQRRPSTQDITWLLDLHQNNQLNLEPPYQRRSVWTLRDRQFFLDTVFRNYPCPAIFLHKTISGTGKATYHVVDGKQRTQTILMFVADGLRVPNDFGDLRLDGKKWSELQGDADLRQRFWNYQITVEMLDVSESSIVNAVFDRLNRNSRRLTAQELRHARFEGWLISEVETESTRDEWRQFGVVTTARAKRMVDSQFISELMLVVLEGRIFGFDQDTLDELYAKYENPADAIPAWEEERFSTAFRKAKAFLLEMEQANGAVTRYARGFANFYTLWAAVALVGEMPDAATAAARYVALMEKVERLAAQDDLSTFLRGAAAGEYTRALNYLNNARGATTDLRPREERFNVLRDELLGQ